jgi:hypothetical protein
LGAKNVGVSSLTDLWQGSNSARGPITVLTGPRSTILVSSGEDGLQSLWAHAEIPINEPKRSSVFSIFIVVEIFYEDFCILRWDRKLGMASIPWIAQSNA